MPKVDICSKAGPATISYTISTPFATSVNAIDRSIPTIIFLHPVYVARAIFHNQFVDPDIRRFNLLALDFRLHGKTKGSVPLDWNSSYAADDVYHFMEALKLPPCHFFGISKGSSIALQLSIDHPDKVLSLFLVSPLPFTEDELVASGRQEIFECFAEGAPKGSKNIDDSALRDAAFGALDFGFNRSDASIVNALVQLTVPDIINTIILPGRLDELQAASVTFFISGQPHTASEFKRVKCPVHLVHCGGDIAYPLEGIQEIKNLFEEAGKGVQLTQVPDAPHFGSVTHREEFNGLFVEWLEEHASADALPANRNVKSPFEEDLMRCGLGDDDDSDDELVPI